jgi:biopolymer transport protein ExbD
MSNNSVVIAVISAAAYESNAASTATASRALKYEMDGVEFPISDLEDLVGMIATKKEAYDKITSTTAKGEFFVEVRADARVHFSEIRPVIEAIARAKIPKMAITARRAA